MENIVGLDANNNRSKSIVNDCSSVLTTGHGFSVKTSVKIGAESENETCNVAVSMSQQQQPSNSSKTTSSTITGTASASVSHDNHSSCSLTQPSIDQTFCLPFNGPSSSAVFDKSTSIPYDFIVSNAGTNMKLPLSRSCSGQLHESLPPMNENAFWSHNWNSYSNHTGSNDSSYDSDQDSNRNSCSDLKQFVIDLVDSGNSTTPEYENHNYGFGSDTVSSSGTVVAHEEINRTNSETLDQEFREYVTYRLMLPNSECSNNDNSDDDNEPKFDPTLLDSSSLASYQNNLNYALKLGYTEKHLQKTILKLGLDVEKNELLGELIRISDLDQTCSKGTLRLGTSEFTHVQRTLSCSNQLRPIVIDGSNVAIRFVLPSPLLFPFFFCLTLNLFTFFLCFFFFSQSWKQKIFLL